MKKKDMIMKLQETGLTKGKAEEVLNLFLQTIQSELVKGEKVTFTGFGTFSVRNRSSRFCRNPKTGEKVQVPARKYPAFKAGKVLKEYVNK